MAEQLAPPSSPAPSATRRRRPLWLRLLVVLFWVMLGVGLLSVGVAIALRLPPVQTRITAYLADIAYKKTGFRATIGRVDLNFYDAIHLQNLVVYDLEGRRMLELEEATIDFTVSRLLRREVALDEIVAGPGHLRIVTQKRDSEVNINQLVQRIDLWINPEQKISKNPAPFYIYAATLQGMQVSIWDERKAHIPGFDYTHMHFDSTSLVLEDFRARADTIEANILALKGRDVRNNWPVRHLSTFFRISRNTMTLDDLHADVGRSHVADRLAFAFSKTQNLGEIVDSVVVSARFRKTYLDYRDLALFNQNLVGKRDSIRLSGDFDGRVKDFTLRRMDLRFGQNTHLKGELAMRGLPDFYGTKIHLKLKPSYLNPADLRPYVPAQAMPYLERLGVSDFEGSFDGLPEDFAAKGVIYSDLGTLMPDGHITLAGPEKTTYGGTFSADRLQLGKLLGMPETFQILTGKGRMVGRGMSLAAARTEVTGTFKEVGFLGYPYKNVEVDGKVERNKFEGYLAVQDINLTMEADGLADMRQKRAEFDLKLDLKKAHLQALGFAHRPVALHGRAMLKGSGSDIDDAEGTFRLADAAVDTRGQHLEVDTLLLNTRRDGRQRSIKLVSSLASGAITGDFSFKTIGRDLEAALNDYGRLFRNVKAMRNHHSIYSPGDYSLHADFDLADITPVIRLFEPDIQVAQHAHLEGDLQKSSILLAQLGFKADFLTQGQTVLDKPELDLTTSKSLDSANVLAELSIYSPTQRVGNLYTKDLIADGVWRGEQIDFRTAIKAQSDSGYVDLRGALRFEERQAVARLRQADVKLFDTLWTVNPGNAIRYDGRRVAVDSLSFTSKTERLAFQGVLGPTPQDSLTARADSLSMVVLDALLPGPFTGKANARMVFNNVLGNRLGYGGRADVTGFTYQGQPIGDVSLNLVPEVAESRVRTTISVSDNGRKTITGGGYLHAGDKDNWDINLKINRAPLTIVEPFISSFASHMAGTGTGSLGIGGAFGKPELTGRIQADSAAFTVDYLKTRYRFSDSVFISPTLISAPGLVLTDGAGNKARLTSARIRHNRFDDFYIDLAADLDNFQVMATTYKDSKLYYGSAYATGDVAIKGPVGDILITANAKTERGTRLFMPLTDVLQANTTQAGYITFVDGSAEGKEAAARAKSRAAADAQDSARQKVNLSGMRLAFNVEVTPEAYGEIIFNKQTGDKVSANGQGRIKLTVDTRGEFSMFGRYNITQGHYIFTFGNVINKDFDILDGSAITWSGDPAGALMDIQARYHLNAPLSPLLIGAAVPASDSAALYNEASRRYPVNVLMNLTGGMLKPDITLAIEVPYNTYPSTLSQYVSSFRSAIAYNEQELNKQVFSLLLLRSYSPLGVNTYSSGGLATGNLTELLSNQLSAWLSDVNKNLEIGVGLGGFSQQAIENFQLRLSYTMLDGRLRLTRNGAFTNTQSQATTASIAGDWTLEYYLRRDGKLRAKIFHRTNQTLAGQAVGGLGSQYYTTTQGASLLHTQSFTSLKDLFPWAYKGYKTKAVAPAGPLPKDKAPVTPTTEPGAPRAMSR